jgi:catechol 2,3-dioxygenase-like lactoylglutathione lyase family enzyme
VSDRGPTATLFECIDHPAIACYDVVRQIEWYCSVLGMRLIASNGADPPAVVLGYDQSTRAGAMIELMPVRDEGPRPETFRRWQPGVRHVALRVSDFAAALEHLRRAGVRFLCPPGEAVGGGQIVSFYDPEGNELQIVQR